VTSDEGEGIMGEGIAMAEARISSSRGAKRRGDPSPLGKYTGLPYKHPSLLPTR
jgi:hypothetical protein